MYIKCPKNINLEYPTIFIGVCHLLMLGFRVFEIVMDLYLLEEVVELNQLTYFLLIMILQLFIVISLFVGATKRQHFFLLPWLCFTAPTFCMATAYATLYVATGDAVQSVRNFLFIAGFWFSWYIVFKNYIILKSSAKYSYKGYNYTSNFKEIVKECGVTI